MGHVGGGEVDEYIWKFRMRKRQESSKRDGTPVQITPPETFNFSHPSEWPKWIRRFERFHIATGIDSKPEDYQVNSLLYAMGDAADDVLAVLPLSADDKKKYDAVKTAFE